MNERPDDDAPEGTAALDERALAALVGRLRDVELPTDEVRTRHLSAALRAFDGEPAPVVAPVVDIATRRHRARTQRLLAAAAVVLLAGAGLVVGVRANSTSDSDLASEQSDADGKASEETVTSDSGDSAELSAGYDPSALPPGAVEADDGFSADAAAPEATVPSTQIQATVASPPDLGAFASDAELRVAIDGLGAVGSTREGAVTTTAPPPAALPNDALPNTAATTAAAVLERCSASLPAGSYGFYTATVAGSPVLVIATPAADGTQQSLALIDGADCTRRPL